MPSIKRASQVDGPKCSDEVLNVNQTASDQALGQPPAKRHKPEMDAIPSYIRIAVPDAPGSGMLAPKGRRRPINISCEHRPTNTPAVKSEFVSGSKLDKSNPESMFEREAIVILRYCNDIIRAHKGEDNFITLFRENVAVLKRANEYKEAGLNQKRMFIRSVEQEVKLKMDAPGFKMPEPETQANLKVVDLRDDNAKLVIQETQRDVRHWYPDQMKIYEPSIIRRAQMMRASRLLSDTDWDIKCETAGQPETPTPKLDLSFLKEKKKKIKKK